MITKGTFSINNDILTILLHQLKLVKQDVMQEGAMINYEDY